MNSNKIIRTICYFSSKPSQETVKSLDEAAGLLIEKGYTIQTKRICSPEKQAIKELDKRLAGTGEYIFGLGTLKKEEVNDFLPLWYETINTSFNLDLTDSPIALSDAEILFKIMREKPTKTFNFAYVFENVPSSPFFPSSAYEKEGFSVGLQPTDLSLGCQTLTAWLEKMKTVWEEINHLFSGNNDFLGIDSSIAPLTSKAGSFVGFIKRLGLDFSHSATTSLYLQITKYLKENNPHPAGLCGLMFPCLEDRELAKEYEKGNFSLERNIYLSLHSGLGVDTYPIGMDEEPARVVEILKLVQGLANKYKKPLSVRFVSDGRAKTGEKTEFQNQYLTDVVIRKL